MLTLRHIFKRPRLIVAGSFGAIVLAGVVFFLSGSFHAEKSTAPVISVNTTTKNTTAVKSSVTAKPKTAPTSPAGTPSAAPTMPTPTHTAAPQPVSTPTPAPVAQGITLNDDSSYHVVINKKHPNSPLDYIPPDLVAIGSQQMRNAPATAIRQMQADSGANVWIIAASGYRSYATQTSVYNGYVAQYGQASADTFSARPGYSEHQSGLAMDFSPIDQSFASTAQFSWLQANAYKYGFILRYPDGKTDVTGYEYEPWHWRYVGTTVATDMHDRGVQTLEEYYSVSGGGY
jgi:D-alanyl-D-alanine carboxypeptidase